MSAVASRSAQKQDHKHEWHPQIFRARAFSRYLFNLIMQVTSTEALECQRFLLLSPIEQGTGTKAAEGERFCNALAEYGRAMMGLTWKP